MADEEIYENADWIATAGKALTTPALPPRPKKSAPLGPLSAVLILLLGISLVAVAVLCARLVVAQSWQSHGEGLLAIQARLGTFLASQALAEKRNGGLLELLSSGWALYNGSWYFFSEEKRPWREAEEACVSLGAHLASVTSRKEMGYIARKTKGQPFWIGLNDQQEEGNWTWVDSTQYSQDVSFWAPEQPDNWQAAPGHQEDCVQVRSSDLNSWNDISCTSRFKWICKKIFYSLTGSDQETTFPST